MAPQKGWDYKAACTPEFWTQLKAPGVLQSSPCGAQPTALNFSDIKVKQEVIEADSARFHLPRDTPALVAVKVEAAAAAAAATGCKQEEGEGWSQEGTDSPAQHGLKSEPKIKLEPLPQPDPKPKPSLQPWPQLRRSTRTTAGKRNTQAAARDEGDGTPRQLRRWTFKRPRRSDLGSTGQAADCSMLLLPPPLQEVVAATMAAPQAAETGGQPAQKGQGREASPSFGAPMEEALASPSAKAAGLQVPQLAADSPRWLSSSPATSTISGATTPTHSAASSETAPPAEAADSGAGTGVDAGAAAVGSAAAGHNMIEVKGTRGNTRLVPRYCPACHTEAMTQEVRKEASKRGRPPPNNPKDPRNLKANLTKEFLCKHLQDAHMSYRDICIYHGHCASTIYHAKKKHKIMIDVCPS